MVSCIVRFRVKFGDRLGACSLECCGFTVLLLCALFGHSSVIEVSTEW
jgi:hypothetical protein